jgi:hypothetical protein
MRACVREQIARCREALAALEQTVAQLADGGQFPLGVTALALAKIELRLGRLLRGELGHWSAPVPVTKS